jgi:hypothetical protein
MASLPGKILYQLWHRPVCYLRDLREEGGPLERYRTSKGRREMEAAAWTLPRVPSRTGAGPAVSLHFLTGRRYWYQTAFCLYSFANQADVPVSAEIHDDGSLLPEHREALQRLGLPIRFHDRASAMEALERHLPVSRYPVLRERWINYPHIRKLIDVHLGSAGWKLVLDSDLLFFRRPGFLLEWLANPAQPLCAVDCEESYGYSLPLMESLAGAPIPRLVNVGLCGLRSESIDWDLVESWCRQLIEREKTSYFLEQALVAMLAARQPCTMAPAADYVTLPDEAESSACTAVMHHYVMNSKKGYFRHNWQRVLPDGDKSDTPSPR